MRVLSSDNYSIDPEEYRQKLKRKRESKDFNQVQYLVRWPWQYIKRLKFVNGVQWETRQSTENEDRFWSERAVRFDPDFKVAPFDLSFKFAFECEPRMCFEKNDHQLPFGCHAWPRYDRAFWEPYLLS